MFLLAREMRRDEIEVAPIAVPARLAEAGLASEVVALRLLDQLEATARVVRTESVERPTTELAGAQPDFNVPIAGLSLRSTAQLLRRVLGYRERRVTGEIVVESGDKLSLRLRLSGHGQIVDLHGYPISDIDTLLRDAAPLVWRPLLPQLYAWWVADTIDDQQKVRERLAAIRRDSDARDPGIERTIMFLSARSLTRSGRIKEAMPIFEELVVKHPSWPGSWSGRALALAGTYQGPKAVEDLRKAISLDARWVAGHAQLSRTLQEMAQPAEALRAADTALVLDPDDLTALTARVASLRSLGRHDDAVRMSRAVVASFPRSANARSELAWSLLRRRDHAGALAAFEAGLEISARHGGLLSGKIETLLALNRPEEALTVANIAVASEPGSALVQSTRGWVLRRLGRHEESLTAFTRASQLNEHSIWAGMGKAQALTSLGRREEAIATYRQVISSDPNNLTKAQEALLRLQDQPSGPAP